MVKTTVNVLAHHPNSFIFDPTNRVYDLKSFYYISILFAVLAIIALIKRYKWSNPAINKSRNNYKKKIFE